MSKTTFPLSFSSAEADELLPRIRAKAARVHGGVSAYLKQLAQEDLDGDAGMEDIRLPVTDRKNGEHKRFRGRWIAESDPTAFGGAWQGIAETRKGRVVIYKRFRNRAPEVFESYDTYEEASKAHLYDIDPEVWAQASDHFRAEEEFLDI